MGGGGYSFWEVNFLYFIFVFIHFFTLPSFLLSTYPFLFSPLYRLPIHFILILPALAYSMYDMFFLSSSALNSLTSILTIDEILSPFSLSLSFPSLPRPSVFDWNVDMTNFDIEVVLNISGDFVWVSLALTRESLHRRHIKHFGPTTLRSTIAMNLLKFSGVCVCVRESLQICRGFCLFTWTRL